MSEKRMVGGVSRCICLEGYENLVFLSGRR